MNIVEISEYLKRVKNRDNTFKRIDSIKRALSLLKKNYLKLGNEKEANEVWRYEKILEVQTLYIQSYNNMKQKRFYDAWCTLEECELNLFFLENHFLFTPQDDFSLIFIREYITKFQALYPYEIFISPEIVETKKYCSICNKQVSMRKPCKHDIGELYNGEICLRHIDEYYFVGTAFVKSPLQKYSVPFLIDKTTRKHFDHYDYSLIDYLLGGLQNPFDVWNMEYSFKRHPHHLFGKIEQNQKCPCRSGKKYKQCCSKESGIIQPHYEFVFEVPSTSELKEQLLFLNKVTNNNHIDRAVGISLLRTEFITPEFSIYQLDEEKADKVNELLTKHENKNHRI